jgi:hypothetical protein
MSTEAKIQISVEGAESLKKAFEEISKSAKSFSQELGTATATGGKLGEVGKVSTGIFKQFGVEVGKSLKTVASTALGTITAINTISFAQAMQSARDFDTQLVRFSSSGGRGISDLRDNIRSVSRQTLLSEQETLAWGKAIGSVTYNYDKAIDSAKAASKIALATHQDTGQQQGFIEALGISGVTDENKIEGITEKIAAMSKALGTSGGFAALKDQLGGLAGPMTMMGKLTDEGREKFFAFNAALTKNLSPQQAQRVQQQAVGALAGHAEGLRRALGTEILDENGEIKDVPGTISKIQADLKKRYGAAAPLVARNTFGLELGSAINNFDQGAYQKALDAKPGNVLDTAQKTFEQSAEFKRAQNDLKIQQSKEDLARSVNPLNNAFAGFVADHPLLAEGAKIGTGILGASAINFGANVLKSGAGGIGSIASGLTGALPALAAGAAGIAGYGIGAVADNALGISDYLSGTGKHSTIGLEDNIAFSRDDIRRTQAAQNNLMSTSEKQDQKSGYGNLAKEIAQAISDVLKANPLEAKVSLTNNTDTPITGVQKVNKGKRQ